MGYLELKESPHAPGVIPVRIHYREAGAGKPFDDAQGKPVVFLHGGWGYGYYPIDRQVQEFGGRFHFLIPDRTGYGKSSPVTGAAAMDFHRRAAEEMSRFLALLGIEKCSLWGHSDGAVIAAMMGLAEPKRYERIVLEAFHFYKRKKGSTGFFERLAVDAQVLGEGTQKRLAADHGEAHWKEVVQRNAEVWVRIGKSSQWEDEDLFDGQLANLAVPALFVHGRKDPRTEPGEVERAGELVTGSTVRIIENGKHCPHSETAAAGEFNAVLGEFLEAKS
jgi:pimeloyl-ACP methyl ester carboxylesterase